MLLKAFAAGPKHGYGVALWLDERSASALRVDDGALYTALHRLEERGWARFTPSAPADLTRLSA